MKRGLALKATTMMLGLFAIACAAWWVWDRADPVVEFERAKAKFAPKAPPWPWKGKAPGMPPPKKLPPPPDTQQTPQTEARPRLQAPLRLHFRP